MGEKEVKGFSDDTLQFIKQVLVYERTIRKQKSIMKKKEFLQHNSEPKNIQFKQIHEMMIEADRDFRKIMKEWKES